MSTTISYQRTGLSSVEMPATYANTIYEMVDDSGIAVKAKSVDFIISQSDLDTGGFGEPQLGDKVVIVSGVGTGSIYEALQLAGGNHYRPHDPHGNAVRIHTKQTGPCEI